MICFSCLELMVNAFQFANVLASVWFMILIIICKAWDEGAAEGSVP